MHSDILLIDDDPGIARLLGHMLVGIANARFAIDGREAIAQIRRGVPDLILLDAQMPDMHGFDLCRVIKAEPALKDVPVIFVTAHAEQEFEVRALEAGACDFIAKPVNEAVLRARVTTHLQVRRLTASLRELATTDALTGLANRRECDAVLTREWRRSRRNGASISLLMVDIDRFRAYNEHYGRPAGDQCLRDVAGVLQQAARRPADLVARHGGEEFAVILPETGRDGAMHVAQAIMDRMSELALPHDASDTAGRVTLTIGVTSYDPLDPNWREPGAARRSPDPAEPDVLDFAANADRALRKARRAGRARIQFREGGQKVRRAPAPTAQPATEPAVPAMAAPRAGAAEWPHVAGVDWEQSRLRLAGNRQLFQSMLTRLVDEFGSLDSRSLARQDAAHVTARLHKLKGSAGTLGAVDLQTLAARAEQAMRSGNHPEAGVLVDQVQQQIALIRADSSLAMVG